MDGSQGVPLGEIDSGRCHTFITQLKRICEDGRLDIFLAYSQAFAGLGWANFAEMQTQGG